MRHKYMENEFLNKDINGIFGINNTARSYEVTPLIFNNIFY